MRKNLMLSIIKDNQIDCPQELNEVYFDSLEIARKKGVELLKRYNCDVFIIRKLTTGIGHYKTIGYFNRLNEYIRW